MPTRNRHNAHNARNTVTRHLVHDLFDRQVERSPDAVAVESGSDQLTYRELGRRADRFATRLRCTGVRADTRVGIALGRSTEMTVALLGILKAGGAAVPLDLRYPKDRLEMMIEDAAVHLVVTERSKVADLPQSVSSIVLLDAWDWTADEHAGARTEQSADRDVLPTSLAYVVFTSGSTGRPKGVAMVHRSLANLVEWQKRQSEGLPPAARTLQFASLGFDVSFQEIFSTWVQGGTVVMMPEEYRWDPDALWNYIGERHIHRLFLPFVALEQVAAAADRSGNFSVALREVITAGEQLQITPSVRNLFARLSGTRLVNQYGPSETHVATSYVLPEDVRTWESLPPIGQPIANARVYILRPDRRPVDGEEAGEIFIGGDCLARGYLDRDDLTAERFVPDPFSDERDQRMYRTGDLARRRGDGNIEFLGRADTQIKIRGYRVELGEVETMLAACPGVRQGVVAARGAGSDRRLVAYVVAEAGFEPDTARRFLGARLADYMVPADFVLLDALPLTPSGKIDRRSLPEDDPAIRNVQAQVEGKMETIVADVWKRVLERDVVDAEATYFDQGGTSISLAKVRIELEDVLGRKISIVDLFRYPTVRSLAAYLSGNAGRSTHPDRRAFNEGSRSKTPAAETAGVAIVGMAGRFPGAANVRDFWDNLCRGKESLTTFTEDELIAAGTDPSLMRDPAFVATRGVLEGADLFDADFFGMTPRDAELTDPQQRIFLECAWEALEDGGMDPAAFAGAVGVFAGSSLNTYFLTSVLGRRATANEFARAFQVDGYNVLVASDKDYLAPRVAHKLNLRGPAITVQTACSTSLVAVCQAFSSLVDGQCDLALAGGVSVSFPQHRGYLYQEGAIASSDGHCRPFDRAAAGTVFGAGVGVVLLKRLADAMADRDHIYAVIKGVGLNNDGAGKVSFSAPSVEGQAGAIGRALASSGVSADSIGYVEGHGTATPLGDPIEVAALTAAFRQATDKAGYCALGSVKSNVGHLEAAAGVTGLIKAALAVKYGMIPPTLHFGEPNPECHLETSPFYVNAELRSWSDEGGLRRGGVSSFGVGGTNAHVVIEQFPFRETRMAAEEGRAEFLPLSARTPKALERMSGRLASFLDATSDGTDPAVRSRIEPVHLADVAYTLQSGRRQFPFRRIVIASDRKQASDRLLSPDPPRLSVSGPTPDSPPRVVFLFPGQGAQHAGMGRGLYASEPVFRSEVDRGLAFFRSATGVDLSPILFPDDPSAESAARRMSETAFAQPALLIIEHALARQWMAWGIRPAAMIGHSVGEYAAAVVAGVMTLEDALGLVAERGRLMQDMPRGAMLSVRLSEDEVRPMLGSGIDMAAVNGPTMSVVAGPEESIASFETGMARRGVMTRRLHTSHAFHSSMMEPVVAPFAESVARVPLEVPQATVVSSVTGKRAGEDWRDPWYWARQIRHPVRFAEAVETLCAEGGYAFLEVGPGETLTALASQTLAPDSRQFAVRSMPGWKDHENPSSVTDDLESMRTAAARLWLGGVDIQWERLRGHGEVRRVPLPGYPFERKRHWIEPASGAELADPIRTTSDAKRPDAVVDLVRQQLTTMRLQLEDLASATGRPDDAQSPTRR